MSPLHRQDVADFAAIAIDELGIDRCRARGAERIYEEILVAGRRNGAEETEVFKAFVNNRAESIRIIAGSIGLN